MNVSPMNRKNFLKMSGSVAGLFFLSQFPIKVDASSWENEDFSFAVIADTHIEPYSPHRSEYIKKIFSSFQSKDIPSFVLHLGDLIEAGLPEEYQEFHRLIPENYRNRLYAIRGNHEVRWDEWAGELFHDVVGKSQYSFDFGEIHFIALDPTQLLQEPGFFTKDQLNWLEKDLKSIGRKTPVVLYLHYPIGDNNYFISNEEALFEMIESYNVRLILSGHVHKEQMWMQNGCHIFSLPAAKDAPVFFWIEKKTIDKQPLLSVHHAGINEEGIQSRTVLTEIPLTGARPAEHEKPKAILFQQKYKSSEGELKVILDPRTKAKEVLYQFWPDHKYAGKDDGNWEILNQVSNSSLRFEKIIDLHSMPIGKYRLQIRVKNERAEWWDSSKTIQIEDPHGTSRLEWQEDLLAPIQADLTSISSSNLVIATTTAGSVTAIYQNNGKEKWSRKLKEPIYSQPALNNEETDIYVGTSDRMVYCIRTSNGETVWKSKTPSPVLGNIYYDNGELIIPSGHHIVLMDAQTGKIKWLTEVSGFTAGMPTADDKAIYLGAGDGKAYALDRINGQVIWESTILIRETPYKTLIYSPWATKATIVPSKEGTKDLVYVSNVSNTYALNRHTGNIEWKFKGGFLYSAPLILIENTMAVLADEWGKVSAIDPYSGKLLWQTTTKQRVFNASPVKAEGEKVYISGVNGLLTGLDLKNGSIIDEYHFSTDYVYSTPIVQNGQIIQAGQDGIVQAIRI
ncbi:Outer membrane protein assembly factor BamB [Bacillus rhizoplanae]|uniref:Outer membrane protein assembly factor BamB n=1 Tax=Bacillus rhizoplanae TaxID=2880966 RepID=A0ABM8YHA5_9BACI|nr:PQQ-binding-like beta-propeller repeat protein [Bacillus rhizoplanae]CAG9615077.1 Outer membrane protein assembly factor BamB [Bacillus rhizoplanae]